ncbi:MAG: hypothetical protein HYV09_39885 [Deltaproteobacteria bacterium]|nr:hypothetical protein [Deltaproteobacteria bacterium]
MRSVPLAVATSAGWDLPVIVNWMSERGAAASDLRVAVVGRDVVYRVPNGAEIEVAGPGPGRERRYRVQNLFVTDACGARKGWRITRLS